ncbi:MAG: hypothetical protein WCQ83_01855, partial [Endomicrobiia bacterium]
MINDKHINIVNNVSFLPGIHTIHDVNTGWTAIIKQTNFKIFLLSFNFDKKKYIKNIVKINNGEKVDPKNYTEYISEYYGTVKKIEEYKAKRVLG